MWGAGIREQELGKEKIFPLENFYLFEIALVKMGTSVVLCGVNLDLSESSYKNASTNSNLK